MAWTEPKTDWVSTDYFNADDYNRIKNNLEYLSDYAEELFSSFSGITDMGDDKATDGTDLVYASELNLFATNLNVINDATYSFDIDDVVTFEANALTTGILNFLIVIESYSLLIYETLIAQKSAKERLAFTLGGQKGVKT